jgi:hypothetical protein
MTDVTIGLGCFHFGLAQGFGGEFTWEYYCEEVEKALESISNLTELSIEHVIKPEEVLRYEHKDPASRIDEIVGAHPPIGTLRISFQLYLPYRVQKQFFPIKSLQEGCPTFTENFIVLIKPTYLGIPLAFIELLEPSRTPDPSSAVVVIREFLKAQLPDMADRTIRFESLGPSPFHADIFFSLDASVFSEEQAANLKVECELTRDYDLIRIFANPQVYETTLSAKEAFIDLAKHELALYYWIIQNRNLFYKKWQSLENSVQHITNSFSKKGLKGAVEKLVFTPRYISKAVEEISQFEIDRISIENTRDSLYKGVYQSTKDVPIFRKQVDQEINNLKTYPVKQMSDLVQFIESRSVKNLEILTNILVGLLGGVTGAIITLIFTR